jgi:hypothetical protein
MFKVFFSIFSLCGPYKGLIKINMSKLDKRLPKNATKFGDHPSISSVKVDVFFIFSSVGP